MKPPTIATTLLVLVCSTAINLASAQCSTGLLTPRTPGTVLQCRGRCVGDGFGQAVLQRSCEAGSFDNFCNTKCCFCNVKINIICRSRACLVTAGLKASVIIPQKVPTLGFKLSVTYIVRSAIWDKETRAAGMCHARTTGAFFVTKLGPISNQDVENVKEAVLRALLNVRGRFVCANRLKKIAMKAADEALKP